MQQLKFEISTPSLDINTYCTIKVGMKQGDLQRAQAYAILRSIGEGMAFYQDYYRDWIVIILMITL